MSNGPGGSFLMNAIALKYFKKANPELCVCVCLMLNVLCQHKCFRRITVFQRGENIKEE